MVTDTRKYEIGSDITIEDNGHSLTARWDAGGGSHSVGCHRPVYMPPGRAAEWAEPMPDQLSCLFSLDGRTFYVEKFGLSVQAWLGTKVYASREEMNAEVKPTPFGSDGAVFTDQATGVQRFREVLLFSMWKVQHEQAPRLVDRTDAAVADYLTLAQQCDTESMERFNKAIAFSGRTFAQILKAIGRWEPLPESPVVKLF